MDDSVAGGVRHCHGYAALNWEFEGSTVKYYTGAQIRPCSWYNDTAEMVVCHHQGDSGSQVFRTGSMYFGDDWNKWYTTASKVDVTSRIRTWRDFSSPRCSGKSISGYDVVRGTFIWSLGSTEYWWAFTEDDGSYKPSDSLNIWGDPNWHQSSVTDPLVSARFWKDYNPNPTTGQGTWQDKDWGKATKSGEYPREDRTFYIHCEVKSFSGKTAIGTVRVPPPEPAVPVYFVTGLDGVENMPPDGSLTGVDPSLLGGAGPCVRNGASVDIPVWYGESSGIYMHQGLYDLHMYVDEMDGWTPMRYFGEDYDNGGYLYHYGESLIGGNNESRTYLCDIFVDIDSDTSLRTSSIGLHEGYAVVDGVTYRPSKYGYVCSGWAMYVDNDVNHEQADWNFVLTDSRNSLRLYNTNLGGASVYQDVPLMRGMTFTNFAGDIKLPYEVDISNLTLISNWNYIQTIVGIADHQYQDLLIYRDLPGFRGNPWENGNYIDGTHYPVPKPVAVYIAPVWSYAPVKLCYEYNIPLEMISGAKPAYKMVTPQTQIGTLPSPTCEGADFLGWYYDMNFTQPVKETDIYKWTEDRVIFAKWRIRGYGILYKKGQTDK